MKRIDHQMLTELSVAARDNPRLRQHLNLHDSYTEPCQRLLNAMEPGSYIQPHRHYLYPKIEFFVALRGRMVLLIFSDSGKIIQTHVFSAGGDLMGAEVPPGAWHTVVSLMEGSVFLEVKPGPYTPLTAKDRAPWAPEEGSPAAKAYLENLVKAVRRGKCEFV